MLITERAQARRVQQQMLSHAAWAESQPAVGQHPDEMSAGKKEHIAGDCSGTLHHAIRALTYLRRRFATGAAVSEQLPVWTFSQDLGRAQPLIFAVVPFHEIGIGFRKGCEPRQFAGTRRALQGAGKYLCELHALQPFPK